MAGSFNLPFSRLRAQTPERSVRLGRRRIFILPTRGGLLFGLLLAALQLGAINYSNSLTYFLLFLLASVALVSIVHTFRNLHGLGVRTARCTPVFAGERAHFPLLLENDSGRLRQAIELIAEGEPPITLDLPPGGISRGELGLPAPQRGRLPLGRVTLATRFPLGLFRAWSPLRLDAECIVYPAPADEGAPPLPSPGGSGDGALQGEGRDDFAGLRAYRPGDSLRHVHWKAHARGQGLLTKEFAGARPREVWLSWQSLHGGDTERRLSLLCRAVLDAEAKGLCYGLELPGQRVEPGSGPVHCHRCLEALALFGEAR